MRRKMTISKNNCPCRSGDLYQDCCKPYHEGSKFPEKAVQLMRSRFSAYAYCLPDYIIDTTHMENPSYEKNRKKWKKSIEEFSSSTLFKGLVVHEEEENIDKAIVIFTAFLESQGKDISFKEKSFFQREDGRWFYHRGEVMPIRKIKIS